MISSKTLHKHDTCWMPLTENPHCAEACNSVSTTMTSKDLGQGWSFRGGVCLNEALGSGPSTHEPGMMAHACTPSTKAEEQELQKSRYPVVHSEFKACLGYTRPTMSQTNKMTITKPKHQAFDSGLRTLNVCKY